MSQVPLNTLLLNRYQVSELIHIGSVSLTYLAKDLHTGQPVIVKIANKEAGDFEDADFRVHQEASFLVRLRGHYAFPELLARDEFEGANFLVRTFIHGENLRVFLKRRAAASSPLTEDEFAQIAQDLLEAIGYAHGLGLRNRDLKPENLVRTDKGHIVLIDFDLGTCWGSQSHSSDTLVGTFAYMCPESLKGDEQVDHRGDLYAAGLILYELAVGRHPFADCTDLSQVLNAHLKKQPQDLAEVRPDLPPRLTGMVMRLLQKSPSGRFPSAASALCALHSSATCAHAPVTEEAKGIALSTVWLMSTPTDTPGPTATHTPTSTNILQPTAINASVPTGMLTLTVTETPEPARALTITPTQTRVTRVAHSTLENVNNNGRGSCMAYFGYYSENTVTVTIPIGPGSKYSPLPEYRGQPMVTHTLMLTGTPQLTPTPAGSAICYCLVG